MRYLVFLLLTACTSQVTATVEHTPNGIAVSMPEGYYLKTEEIELDGRGHPEGVSFLEQIMTFGVASKME